MPSLPPVTRALIIACVVALALQTLLPVLETLLALWPPGSGRFWPWQVVTYALLHSGVAHLMFNMLGLWMFGAELEQLWGPKRYWQLLAASTVAAAACQLAFTALIGMQTVTTGASGAVFGLLLAYGMAFPRRQFDLVGFLPVLLLMIPVEMIQTLGIILFVVLLMNRQAVPIPPVPIPAMTMVAIYGAISLFFGVMATRSGIAHFAHLGGMLGAFLLIRYWRGQPPFSSKRRF
jgi:membrane associated rhomboid family serine protease